MSGTKTARQDPMPSEEVRAEAAAWIAQLHDERRSPDLEARVHAWLGESEEHRRAFNRMTEAWERSGSIRLRPRGDVAAEAGRRRRFTPRRAALAALLVLISAVLVYYRRDNAVVTGIGQQQVRLLRDGTRVVLNTDTRIEVNYDEHARRVRLIRGEAWFDVAKRPTWPFLVSEDTPLAEAADEMNRYSTTHITVADADIGRLRVGGVFRAGDSDEFVRIVSAAFTLQAERHGNEVLLSRAATTKIFHR